MLKMMGNFLPFRRFFLAPTANVKNDRKEHIHNFVQIYFYLNLCIGGGGGFLWCGAYRTNHARRRGAVKFNNIYCILIAYDPRYDTLYDFQQCGMCDQQRLRSACTNAQSDLRLC